MGRYSKRNKATIVNSELDFSQRFLLANCYRFARNFIQTYQGHLEDEDFFDPITKRITPTWLKRIFTQCTTRAQARTMLNLEKDDDIDISGEDPNELLLKLWEHPYSNPRLREKNCSMAGRTDSAAGFVSVRASCEGCGTLC